MTDFRAAHIQDVSAILERRYTHSKLDDILARFEAQELEDGLYGSSKVDRLRCWLRNGDGTVKGRAVLAHLIENARFESDEIAALECALSGSRFLLHSEDGHLKLALRLTATAEVQVHTHRSFVEAHAPAGVLEEITKAEDALFRGEWGNALHHGRRALEALTTDGNFAAALDEMVSMGLIQQWSAQGQKRTFDREFLYGPYGYCSSIGSHRQGDANMATAHQAELGIVVAEETVHYLLRLLKQAHDQGNLLSRWQALGGGNPA